MSWNVPVALAPMASDGTLRVALRPVPPLNAAVLAGAALVPVLEIV